MSSQNWKQTFTNNCLYAIKHNGLGIKSSLKPCCWRDAEARCAELFKQKMQELEAMKTLYKKLLNESKNQEIIARDAGNYCDRPGDINQDGAKVCDDCCEELYWSKKRESELCPNCDIDESDDEEDK